MKKISICMFGMISKFVEKYGERGHMCAHIHGHRYTPLKKDNDHI